MKKKCGVLLLCAVMLTALAFVLCACGEDYCYDHAEQYRAGSATLDEPVRNLDIDWIDGGMTIVFGDGQGVALSETAEKALEDRDLLRWWLDGDTLRVKYAENGHHTFDQLQKHLTVTLPALEISEINVATKSGYIHLNRGTARQLRLTTASGTIDALCAAAQAEIKASSGSVRYTDSGASFSPDEKTLSVETASGSVTVTASDMKTLNVKTASGAIRLIAGADQLDAQSASGSITLYVADRNEGFAADIRSSSGKITDALGMRQENGRYVIGDGRANVIMHTTSGDITVGPRQE